MKGDSQLLVNAIHDKTSEPKEIFNLVEDINIVSSLFKEMIIDYSNRLNNNKADVMAKSIQSDYMFFFYTFCFVY